MIKFVETNFKLGSEYVLLTVTYAVVYKRVIDQTFKNCTAIRISAFP